MRNVGLRSLWTASTVCASFIGLGNLAYGLQAPRSEQAEKVQAEKGLTEKWRVENRDGDQRYFVVVNSNAVQSQDSEDEAPKRSKYWLGISLKPVDGDLATYLGTAEGVLVDSIYPESPAEKAGLKKGDILIEVNGEKLAEPQSLLAQMLAVKATDDGRVASLKLNVLRKGESVQIELTPSERPEGAAIRVEGGSLPEGDASEQKGMTIDLRGKSPEDIEKMVEGGLRVFRLGQPTGWKQGGADGELKIEIHRETNGKKLEVSVTRDGDGPAKINVKRDGESKEYSSEKMDEMPEDVREMVQEMLDKNGQVVVEARKKAANKDGDAKAGQREGEKEPSKKSSQSRSRIAIVGPEGLNLNIGEFIKGEAMHKELAEKYRAMAEEIADRAQETAFWAKDTATIPQEMRVLQSQVEALRAEVEALRGELKRRDKETSDK